VGKAETATPNGILSFSPFGKGGEGGFRDRSVAAGRVKSPPASLYKKGGVKAAFLAALLLALPVHADLPPAVAQALKQAGIPDTHVGILVRDLDNPAPLLAHGENRSFNPASVMKLVTTLAALDTLGPAHTFKTRVWVEGEIEGGILTGNLILQGGGDPGLTQERFWLLLREIRARGIREIRGDVILDNSFHELEPIDPGAFDQAPLRPYNAPPAALLANFNTLNLRLGTVGDAVQAKVEADDALPLDNRLEAIDAPCNGWREQLGLRLEEGRLTLAGRYPKACGEQVHPLNLLSPEATVAVLFRTLWREAGGLHTGRIRPCTPGPDARLLMEFDSPPLSSLARDINKFSNNVMAKMLFLNLGAVRYGAPATWDKGMRAAREWLAEKGLMSEEIVLENGSGLSRIERISAASLARLLAYAASRPAYFEFAASLPAIGLEGTQKGRLNGSPLSGLAWLKTGSLNGARNLAGYVLGLDGRRRILVMLINHGNAAAATRAQEALLEWAVGLPANNPVEGGTSVGNSSN
jgi:D-alanyl-D-alanine carboxypeptidase/D-alanyl-D-alanine-endopeptidase (penicillin-binding protein 4)